MQSSNRIYNDPTKIAVIMACGFTAFFVGVVISSSLNLAADVAGLIGAALNLILIYVVTRHFRRAGESPEPRPWWRITASKPFSWTFGVLFLAVGIQSALNPTPTVATVLLAALHISFGLLLFANALKTRPTTS